MFLKFADTDIANRYASFKNRRNMVHLNIDVVTWCQKFFNKILKIRI